MATIIKAGAAAAEESAGVRPIAFNYDDVVTKATAHLEQVRQQAGQILAEARREAEQLKKQAQQQAAAAAEAEARKKVQQEAAAELDRQMQTLRPALEGAMEQIKAARVACTRQWEQNMIRFATAIAGRVIRSEVANRPEIALPLVREALELAVGSQRIRLRLNPRDHAALHDQIQRLVGQLEQAGAAEVVADESIAAGSCVVDTEFGQIDQQWETQLQRIEDELIN